MKKSLFVTFDLIRLNDPPKSLAIASILAALKNNKNLKCEHEFEHLSINLFIKEEWREKTKSFKFAEYSFIAVSAYIWNDIHINDFLAHLRAKGFCGKIILGGYQITKDTDENYKKRYPQADIFVEGFAELKLLKILTEKSCSLQEMPSVYLTGEIEVKQNMPMVRFETKRGCPYSCSFCRHRDVTDKLILEFDKNRIIEELDFFISMGVKKINVIDPIFHIGKNYMHYLSEIISLCKSRKANTLISLQCRLEFLASSKGTDFLNLCKTGNFELEFGLQTCNEQESILINRRNEIHKVEYALKMLNDTGITHEISLIYGLPNQTLESFSKSVEFLRQKSKAIIKAYPLMLLPGTPLFNEREKYSFKELHNEYGIPYVVSSSSFTYDDWLKMKNIASEFE